MLDKTYLNNIKVNEVISFIKMQLKDKNIEN